MAVRPPRIKVGPLTRECNRIDGGCLEGQTKVTGSCELGRQVGAVATAALGWS
jgi:hypothetical protein